MKIGQSGGATFGITSAVNGTSMNIKAAIIPDWNDCSPTSVDTCASSGWVCCVAPGDVSSNKFTCRPNQSGQCSSITPPPPPSVGSNVADWSTCTNPTLDKCSSTGWVCCGRTIHFLTIII